MTFSFLPADIVSQILNFGLPAPIDIQVVGYDLDGNRAFADKLLERVRQVPGTVDLHIQQPFDQPYLHIDVDRTRAEQIGFTQRDIATNLLVSLSGSFQTTPEFWLNPKSGVSYMIAARSPRFSRAWLRFTAAREWDWSPITTSNPCLIFTVRCRDVIWAGWRPI